jgi:predicted PurR-regulated permease PerM
MTEPRTPRDLRRTSSTVALWILVVLGTLWFLRTARELLIPIALGVIISYALEPLVVWLERWRVPRLAATTVVLLSVLLLPAWGALSLRDDVVRAAETLPVAAQRLRDAIQKQVQSEPTTSVREAAEVLQGNGDATGADRVPTNGAGRSQPARSDETDAGLAPALNPSTMIQWGVQSMATVGGHVLVIFFLTFFLLASSPAFRRRLVEVAGDSERRRLTVRIINDINEQIQRFLLIRLVTSVIVGAATWGVLAWMGVDSAAMWGALAGVLNSIPYFGPVIVSGGLLVVGLLQEGGLVRALQISGAAMVITSLEGYLLEPALFGRAERMSALVIFLGLLLWSWLWGIWGTILAVPMLVIIKSTADHVPWLRPVGRLMAP